MGNSLEEIFIIILSKIFLKLRIYKHRIISLIILIIGFLPLMIDEIFFLIENDFKDLSGFIFIIIICFVNAVNYTLSKIILTNELILPQTLIFYRGIFAFLIHCFIIFPILLICGKINFYKDIITLLSLPSLFINIIIFIQSICFYFFIRVISMKIIYIFSPIHISFLGVILFYLLSIIGEIIINGLNLKIIFFYIIPFIIVIFGTLLFCEIITLNICGLNKDTTGRLEGETIERLVQDCIIEEDIRIDREDIE